MPVEACFFIEQPPEFEYRNGLFHVTQTVGGYRFERVMRPHIFMLALRRAAECAKAHKFGGAEIIDFPGKDEVVAAGH
jgi:hypothetical protein